MFHSLFPATYGSWGLFLHLPVICISYFHKSIKLICQFIALNFFQQFFNRIEQVRCIIDQHFLPQVLFILPISFSVQKLSNSIQSQLSVFGGIFQNILSDIGVLKCFPFLVQLQGFRFHILGLQSILIGCFAGGLVEILSYSSRADTQFPSTICWAVCLYSSVCCGCNYTRFLSGPCFCASILLVSLLRFCSIMWHLYLHLRSQCL